MTHRPLALVVVAALTLTATAFAQSPVAPMPLPPPPPAAPPAPPGVRANELVSLDVQVVIIRSEQGKVTSTQPYTLAVTTNAGEAQLNMGAEVPIANTVFAPVERPSGAPGAAGPGAATPRPAASVTYRPLGAVITCRAMKMDDGRYQLVLQVDDSAYARGPGGAADATPSFRSFRSRNTIMLTDGQTRQYTAASDRVTGETVRLEVTMRVVK